MLEIRLVREKREMKRGCSLGEFIDSISAGKPTALPPLPAQRDGPRELDCCRVSELGPPAIRPTLACHKQRR